MNDLFLSLEPARRAAPQAEIDAILQSLADCLDANRALRGAMAQEQAQARHLRQALHVIYDALTPFQSDQAARHLHPEHQKVLGEIAQYAARALLCAGGEAAARRAA